MHTNTAQNETRQLISECGALLTDDHFVYASGDHGAGWIAKDLVNILPQHPQRLGQLLADACAKLDPAPQLICGPTIGGLICAQVTAMAMKLPFVYAERSEHDGRKSFELHRGFDELVTGKEVLVVDDVINTGFSIGLAIDAVRAAGGTVSSAATWINRGNVHARELGVSNFMYLDEIEIPAWPAQDCPLCAKGVPVNTRYAHGAEFVAGRK